MSEYKATCIITGKTFTDQEAEEHIAETSLGPVWAALWDSDIQFDEYGMALIPRKWKERFRILENASEDAFEKECPHDQLIECYSQEWVSGDCLRLDLQCSQCGKKGTMSVLLDPKNILWEKD